MRKARWMSYIPSEDRVAASIPSLKALRRPLREKERAALAKGSLRIEECDEETKTKIANAWACGLILGAMERRMLDPQEGLAPRFVRRLRKSVKSFERKLR